MGCWQSESQPDSNLNTEMTENQREKYANWPSNQWLVGAVKA
jgi:hypothetical protein